jgi:hypothetical protein
MSIDYDGGIDSPKSEREWRAESDANTLARAAAIQENPTRYAAAKVAAAKLLEDEQKDVRLLSKVSGKPVPSSAKPVPQSPRTFNRKNTKFNTFKRI